jgi:APA family basic amino acid/polyamine antiporter
MASLPGVTWIRFFVWLAFGLIIYFCYGRFHSRVSALSNSGAQVPESSAGRSPR